MNLVVFISTRGHFGKLDMYKSTMEHLALQIDFAYFRHKLLNLKEFAGDAKVAKEIADYFIGLGFKILLHTNEDQFYQGKRPEDIRQNYIIGNILDDMSKTFTYPELLDDDFTFIIEDDSPVILKRGRLEDYLETAKNILNNGTDVASVHFARLMVNHQKVTPLYFYSYHKLSPCDGMIRNGYWYNFQPRVHRSLDLFNAASYIKGNWDTFRFLCPEDGFQRALRELRIAGSFQAFDVYAAYSLHIGEPNGGTIENESEDRLDYVG